MAEQPLLFDLPADWEKEWQGMPEFKMHAQEPAQRIIMNFLHYEAVKEFARRLDLSVTRKTDSLWFPAIRLVREAPSNFQYVAKDEP